MAVAVVIVIVIVIVIVNVFVIVIVVVIDCCYRRRFLPSLAKAALIPGVLIKIEVTQTNSVSTPAGVTSSSGGGDSSCGSGGDGIYATAAMARHNKLHL